LLFVSKSFQERKNDQSILFFFKVLQFPNACYYELIREIEVDIGEENEMLTTSHISIRIHS